MATQPPLPKKQRRRTRENIRNVWGHIKMALNVACYRPHPSLGANTPASANPPIDTLNRAGNIAWIGLVTTLRSLEKNADVFPPMKSAVGALIECMGTVQIAAENRDDYERLASELEILADTVKRHAKELSSENSSGSIANIASSIDKEVERIKEKQVRGRLHQSLGPTEDKEDVIQSYRRVETAFQQLQANVGFQTLRSTHQQVTLLQSMFSIDEARYNSRYAGVIQRGGCAAGTREAVQRALRDWVQDREAAEVYWMDGIAGAGKTTIAYSLCEQLERNKQLGASFFCSRNSSSCRDVNRIIPTIAYQLAQYSPAFRSTLCRSLEVDPGTSTMNISQQFDKLIKAPLWETKTAIPDGVVVVIDALDECSDAHGVRLVLEALMRLAPTLPMKFFVTSRPEPAVQEVIATSIGHPRSVLRLHDIDQSTVGEDIKTYLTDALEPVLAPTSNEYLEQLVERAGGLFIYAATVARYVLHGNGFTNSVARLDTLLVADPAVTKGWPSKKYSQLDDIYKTILSTILPELGRDEKETEAMRLIVGTIVNAKESLTTAMFTSLLGVIEAQVSTVLQPLMSVILTSDAVGRVSILHASFPEFVLDPLRSGSFHCPQAQHNEILAHRCFDIMKEQLRFNICNLESSFTFDKDVPDLMERVEACISPSLFYACRYWGEHLQLVQGSDTLHTKLADFLTSRLLFWMEVLNLNGCAMNGISVMEYVEKWLSHNRKTSADIQQQAADAREFVNQFATSACSRSTPHIYVSALPLCTKSSWVYECYWGRTKGLIDMRGTAMGRRNPAQASWVTESPVTSVAFSPDGTRVVSASNDSIQLWDVDNRVLVTEPFRGHTGTVNSVVFSPNGTHIVSGSADKTIRVWDAQSNHMVVEPLKGHTGQVSSVAYSLDGTRIISGSHDRTIRMWNAYTGGGIGEPYRGHKSSVNSVAFSSDSRRIVSGSHDKTIILWDACTGDTIAGPFRGHTDPVLSVAFSPDGKFIVSGSSDSTVRIWDTLAGEAPVGPLLGHTESVNSVAFSSDGTRIVSGSKDSTIQVWDARSGDLVVDPFKGHTNTVTSVAFSHDSTRLVSGSYDRTIQVWDVHGSVIKPSEGHTNAVTSVAFSPDGTRIVSSSEDNTVRMWHALTGDPIAAPFRGHAGWVNSVVFSPDGSYVASGSSDATVRVWHARTGDTIAGPFRGHTGWVLSVAFSPDGGSILSGSSDSTIRVWHSRTGEIIAGPFNGHIGWVNSVVFSPDGQRIVSGSDDQTIYIWSANEGKPIVGPLRGHIGSVLSVGFSPDGSKIVSGSSDCTIRMWDAHRGDALAAPFEGHVASVKSVTFSPDGTSVVSASYDGTIRAWDARTGHTLAGPLGGHKSVNSIAFSPDGTRIVSGSDDKTIRVWNTYAGGTAPKPLEGHNSLVRWVGPSSQTKKFGFNNDGWMTMGDVPVLWVPPIFRTHMPCPCNTLVIGPKGSVYINTGDLLLGTEWSKCYVS